MSPTHVTPDDANFAKSPESRTRRRMVEAADVNEVMRDQLECLITHAENGLCGCDQCQRYLRARTLLMEVFADSLIAVNLRKRSSSSGQ